MPVDLSPAGSPSAYPTKLRLLPWLVGWLVCSIVGAGVAVLLWPSSTPAMGPWFWFCILGLPTLLYLIVWGVAQTHYEATYAQAFYRNQHRRAWLAQRIGYAQQPLHILASGYCLPFTEPSLSEALAGSTSMIEAQAPRSGAGHLEHTRFADNDPRLYDQGRVEASPPVDDAVDDDTADAPAPPPPIVRFIEHALTPIVAALHVLCEVDQKPRVAVRVMTSDSAAAVRVAHVRTALQRLGLPELECLAATGSDRLMLADAWLDAHEQRALLVVAAEWHDTAPPLRSAEAFVAVLLAPERLKLPDIFAAQASLHRPVEGTAQALADVLAHAVLWGHAEPSAVMQAWLGGVTHSDDASLTAALKQAALMAIDQSDAQRRLDAIVGNAGAARPWLSLAAAIESRPEGPQLLLDIGRTAQAALLYVNPATDDAAD